MEYSIEQRLKHVLQRIAEKALSSGRNPSDIRLVAVSKTKPAENIRQAAAAGANIFGENYIQEARRKIESLYDLDIQWHFIGHLQTNKSKYAVKLFDLIHSVDTIKLARSIDREAAKIGKRQAVLIQVNLSGEDTKSGVSADLCLDLVRQMGNLDNLAVKGLMTMPPFFDDPEKARPYFQQLRLLAEQIDKAGIKGVAMEELSMGMTGDFEVAIEQGATLVRVGTAIFGSRG